MPTDPTFQEAVKRLQGALTLDQSVSVPELGSLFERAGDKPLQRLKRAIASAYGVSWCFPSTNGTTALNILAVLTGCLPGKRILVNRDAHVSVTAAMIHGGLCPTYLVPKYDPHLGLSLGPTRGDVEAALNTHSDISCVFLTAPNYFGIMGEIGEIIALCHVRGLRVIVDAAHAPHFHFCSDLPIGAEDLGADLVSQSTHKVANALSQGSVLLIRDEALVPALYEHVNDLGFVSTSFSYPILASLELAVRQLAEEGQQMWQRTIELAEELRRQFCGIPGVTCFGCELTGSAAFTDLDRTRVALDVSGTALTGFAFESQLICLKIYPEMATLRHVLFLLTSGTTYEDVRRLVESVRKVVFAHSTVDAKPVLPLPQPTVPEMALVPREAKFAQKKTVCVRDAVGEISGETVATYPPGAAIIAAGKIISPEVIEYLQFMQQSGAVLKGASDPTFRTLRIISPER